MYIVSMTTIPSRLHMLEVNLESLLNQSYQFDKLVINIDDNISKEDLEKYEKLKAVSSKIELNQCESKWRSCNKLLPTLQRYPNDVIITVDDDVYYPDKCIEELVKHYELLPTPQKIIIAHEINPIFIKQQENYVGYYNTWDYKFKQVEYGKYLSNCCLFPPHVFDGTMLFDYEKMMKYTNGLHDELWFWLCSTLNGIQCIGLNYIQSFEGEVKVKYEEGDFTLGSINGQANVIKDYMDKISKDFGEQLIGQIKSNPTLFTITKDNIYAILAFQDNLKQLYNYGFQIQFDKDLTSYWRKYFLNNWKN